MPTYGSELSILPTHTQTHPWIKKWWDSKLKILRQICCACALAFLEGGCKSSVPVWGGLSCFRLSAELGVTGPQVDNNERRYPVWKCRYEQFCTP